MKLKSLSETEDPACITTTHIPTSISNKDNHKPNSNKSFHDLPARESDTFTRKFSSSGEISSAATSSWRTHNMLLFANFEHDTFPFFQDYAFVSIEDRIMIGNLWPQPMTETLILIPNRYNYSNSNQWSQTKSKSQLLISLTEKYIPKY